MGSNSRSKEKTKRSKMNSKGKSSYYSYAVLGICIACLPLLVTAARRNERRVMGPRKPIVQPDLMAAESQPVGMTYRSPMKSQSAPVPTAVVPGAAPPPSPPSAVAASQQAVSTYPAPFSYPKMDWAQSPSYNPRYVAPPETNPWKETFPFEVQNFRKRAQDDEAQPDDDYRPSESKGKKHAPSYFKRAYSSVRSAGKAIIGAPSYIYKRYRGSWKKLFGGGKKKKKKGWKSWSQSDSDKNNDGWGGWEEVEPTGGYDHEPSHYPSEKAWGSKGYSKGGGYDSHERRYDNRDSNNYRDYKDREYREKDRDYRDDYKDYKDYDSSYRSPSSRTSRDRDRSKHNPNSNNYREETHYDDYDGRRTTAYYGGSKKSPPSSRPRNNGSQSASGKSGSRYDDHEY